MLGMVLLGCGDTCERLCRDTAVALERCRDGGTTWADLGARTRSDYVDQCRDDWDRTSADLTASDRGEAVETCAEARVTLTSLSCDELRAAFTTR